MKVGTKSLIFGVHQFIWHPITVYMAWVRLYGRPTIKEIICIIIHDWGYWNKPNMDGEEGERHPETGASIAFKLLGKEYHDLCLFHSRHYSENVGVEPSRLCWADKLSITYEPRWFYLLRARLSGELKEYRIRASEAGFIDVSETDIVWFDWVSSWLANQGFGQKSSARLVNPQKSV